MIDRRHGGTPPGYPSEEEILALRPDVEDVFPAPRPEPPAAPVQRRSHALRLPRLRPVAH